MSRFLLIAVSTIAVNLYALSGADEQIRDSSPDGKFALRIGSQNESGHAETGIIELSTHKALLDLGSLGHPNEEDAKLVWSADSQQVAFFEPTKRGGLTRVFFRNDGSFEEVRLPTLPEPKTAKKVPTDAYDKTVEVLQEPVQWLKSGALVIYCETEGDYSGRGALEITIGFDKNRKSSVLNSKKITPRPIGANNE
jgi:hypothetical protein